jgi:hypothetical protein
MLVTGEYDTISIEKLVNKVSLGGVLHCMELCCISMIAGSRSYSDGKVRR